MLFSGDPLQHAIAAEPHWMNKTMFFAKASNVGLRLCVPNFAILAFLMLLSFESIVLLVE
jgi:hypothetical protein